jgi:predicted negative regulator of RcsB-dependent stress response
VKYNMALKDYGTIVGRGPSRYYPRACEKAAQIAYASTKEYPQAFEFARKWEESAGNANSRVEAQLMALQTAYLTGNSVAVGEYSDKLNQSGTASPEQKALGSFYVGKMAYDKGDFGRAYPSLQKVTQNSTSENMAEAYHLMAQILYKQRKYAECEEVIGEGNKNSAGYDDWIARNLILVSDVYADQGDKNSATAALEAIIENYAGDDPKIKETARQKLAKLEGKAPNPTTNKKGANFLELEEGGN